VPSVCWLVEGSDAFGTARAITNLSGQLESEGVTVRFLAVSNGPFVERLRAAGQAIDVLGPTVPVLESGLAPHRLVPLIARWLTSSTLLTWRRRRHAWVGRSHGLPSLRPNLLLAAGLAGVGRPGVRGRRPRTQVVWEMANAVGASAMVARIYRALGAALRIRIIANSRWTASTLVRGRAPCQLVPVMYLSADPEVFAATPHRPFAGRRAITLLMAARVHPSKMQLDVIDCLRDLLSDAPIRLVLAGFEGTTEYERTIIRQLTERGTRRDLVVDVLPVQDRVATLFAEADVVIAARRDPEPFGLTVIEAMMCGRPVLAGGVGGPAETLVDGVTGWLLADPSPAGLRAGIERVLADQHRWAEMGEAAAEHALARFTPDVQARRYRELIGL
jgi:glycosyltransferase involved in cell wall biosynthesis